MTHPVITPALADQRLRTIGRHAVGVWFYDRCPIAGTPVRTHADGEKCERTSTYDYVDTTSAWEAQ